MRRLTGFFGMVKVAPSSCRPMIGSRSSVGADEIAVVDPLLLQEFDRGHRLGAHEQEDGAARHFVIFFETARSDRMAVQRSCRV